MLLVILVSSWIGSSLCRNFGVSLWPQSPIPGIHQLVASSQRSQALSVLFEWLLRYPCCQDEKGWEVPLSLRTMPSPHCTPSLPAPAGAELALGSFPWHLALATVLEWESAWVSWYFHIRYCDHGGQEMQYLPRLLGNKSPELKQVRVMMIPLSKLLLVIDTMLSTYKHDSVSPFNNPGRCHKVTPILQMKKLKPRVLKPFPAIRQLLSVELWLKLFPDLRFLNFTYLLFIGGERKESWKNQFLPFSEFGINRRLLERFVVDVVVVVLKIFKARSLGGVRSQRAPCIAGLLIHSWEMFLRVLRNHSQIHIYKKNKRVDVLLRWHVIVIPQEKHIFGGICDQKQPEAPHLFILRSPQSIYAKG